MKLRITLNTALLILVFSSCRGFELSTKILDEMVKNTAIGTSKLPGETGGLALNMKTDKVLKLFTFETSLYRFSNLSRKVKTHPNIEMLPNPHKEEGKLGQATMSVKLPNTIKGLKGDIKVGKQAMKHGLLSETSSRKAPNTWNGYKGHLKWENFYLSLAKVEKFSPRNEEGYKSITNFKGKAIKNIISTHAHYQTNVFGKSKLKLQYRNAISKNHVRSHNSDIALTIPLEQSLEAKLGAKCYLARKAGHLWESEYRGKPIFNKKANAMNVMGVLSSDFLELEAGISHFQSDHHLVGKSGKIALPGSYYYNFGKNIRGTWDVDTRGFAQDMHYGGETVWMTGVSYKLIGFKNHNLRLNYALRYGSNIRIIDRFNNKQKLSEYEHDFALFFTPGFKGIKGLNFALEYGLYRGNKELMQENHLKRDKLKVWLDYDLLVF